MIGLYYLALRSITWVICELGTCFYRNIHLISFLLILLLIRGFTLALIAQRFQWIEINDQLIFMRNLASQGSVHPLVCHWALAHTKTTDETFISAYSIEKIILLDCFNANQAWLQSHQFWPISLLYSRACGQTKSLQGELQSRHGSEPPPIPVELRIVFLVCFNYIQASFISTSAFTKLWRFISTFSMSSLLQRWIFQL